MEVPQRGPEAELGDEVPQKLKLFCETAHNICIKLQQTNKHPLSVGIWT